MSLTPPHLALLVGATPHSGAPTTFGLAISLLVVHCTSPFSPFVKLNSIFSQIHISFNRLILCLVYVWDGGSELQLAQIWPMGILLNLGGASSYQLVDQGPASGKSNFFWPPKPAKKVPIFWQFFWGGNKIVPVPSL